MSNTETKPSQLNTNNWCDGKVQRNKAISIPMAFNNRTSLGEFLDATVTKTNRHED